MSKARAATLERTRFACPVYGFQEMINGKYKLRIIWALQEGPRRMGRSRKASYAISMAARKSRPGC